MSRRLTTLLTAATVTTYLLVALGATLATGDAAGCATWPSCSAPPTDLGTALALGHRVAAVFAFGLVAAAAIRARTAPVSRCVRALLWLATLAFPLQIALGGALAVGAGPGLGQLHLLVAVGIFVVLLGALVLALEETTAGAEASDEAVAPADAGTEPTPVADPDSPPIAGQRSPPFADEPFLTRVVATARAYVSLTKPRLMWLLCLLAVAGMALASLDGGTVDGVTVVATLAGGVLAIGASGAANQVFEYDRDARMERTADRPLVTGRVSVRGAVAFSLGLATTSTAILWLLVNPLATGLTVLAALYYAVGYTVLLKPRTRWNTVLGGGAGALPAVIGYAAVAGTVGLPGLLLAGVVFLWTPAHFYNLALAYREEYAAGGYPMVPVVVGSRSTRRRIVAWLGTTALATAALGARTELGAAFALVTVGAAAVFLAAVVDQYRERSDASALRTFHASNAYLGAVLLAVVLEALLAAG